LPAFGYPITPALDETDSGQPKTVQYFERARFELAPAGTSLLDQVHLGALGREYPGIVAQCPGQPVAVAPGASQPDSAQPGPAAQEQTPSTHSTSPSTGSGATSGQASSGQSAALVRLTAGRAWWFWALAGLVGLLLVGTIA